MAMSTVSLVGLKNLFRKNCGGGARTTLIGLGKTTLLAVSKVLSVLAPLFAKKTPHLLVRTQKPLTPPNERVD
jgi:hypothetical protein